MFAWEPMQRFLVSMGARTEMLCGTKPVAVEEGGLSDGFIWERHAEMDSAPSLEA